MMTIQHSLKKTVLMSLLLSGASFAAETQCVLRLVKNTCWDSYSATVAVVKAKNLQEISSGTIPKNQQQSNITFPCPFGEPISLRATFSPAFWEGTAEKRYMTKRVWDVPLHLPEKTEKWELSACFPDDFQSVPIPPTMGTNCHCEPPQDIKADK
jgi:hypothetical protein